MRADNMKVVFLDVDGVLNTNSTKTRCGGYIGIDDAKLPLLKEIIDGTGAEIVLISTWKEHWEKSPSRKRLQDDLANHLDERLDSVGLTVSDKTKDKRDGVWYSRGEGILDYLAYHGVNDFVIIDDLQFDYDGCDLTDNFVQTTVKVGLTPEHVKRAIEILNAGN